MREVRRRRPARPLTARYVTDMADPQHTPQLDPFDRMTVALYRAGLVTASVAVIATAVAAPLAPEWVPRTHAVLVASVAVAVLNMHLYNKRIRYALAVLGISGVFFWGLGGFWLGHAGVGLSLAALSGYALKEQFCFKVPGLRLVPLMLAGSVLTMVLGIDLGTAALMGVAGVLLVILCVAKLRMPMHFDVGNKAHYQV